MKAKGWSGQNPPLNFHLNPDKYTSLNSKENKVELKEVPKVKDLLKSNLNQVEDIFLMEKDFLIPEVDKDICLKCGRCYLTCADSGYQAIKFGGELEFPIITDNCTGCSLCFAVCPVPGSLVMVPRKVPFELSRGIEIEEQRFTFSPNK